MKLDGKYTVAAPREHVWNILQDPSLLARVLPGCEKLEALGDDKYSAAVKIQVGPLQGSFAGTIALAEMVTPESYRMTFDGKGALGFVKGTGTVRLVEQGGGGATDVHYAGDASIGGRIATVGQRLMETSARALIEQTFDALTPIAQAMAAQAVAAQSAQGSASSTPNSTPNGTPNGAAPGMGVSGLGGGAATAFNAADIPVRRPSQVEFGLGVLRHMFEDTVPEQYRTPVLIALVLVVALVLISLFGSSSDSHADERA
jgi:hypothetical protein